MGKWTGRMRVVEGLLEVAVKYIGKRVREGVLRNKEIRGYR